jgi:hypothetical protein
MSEQYILLYSLHRMVYISRSDKVHPLRHVERMLWNDHTITISYDTHLRQTDENFYPIRLAVTHPTRARRATSLTHLRQTDEWNKKWKKWAN